MENYLNNPKATNLKVTICVYCGEPADTRDHIPSKNLFKGFSAITPITVPSCKRCNNELSQDEEYFRNLLGSLLYEVSPTATALFDNQISRSVRRRPALGRSMFEKMSLVDVYSEGGIYLGKKTALRFEKKDHQRVFKVLDKYIKGLYFHHFKKIVPKDWALKHFWITPKLERQLIPKAKSLNWRVLKENIFVYGFNWVPETRQSIWILVFFGKPMFFSFAVNAQTESKFKTNLQLNLQPKT